MARRESMRSSMVSPMPMRIPVVKAMLSLPASSMVRSLGVRQAFAHEAWADIFEHEADTGVGVFQTDESDAVHHAGVGVREQAGFLEDEFAHGSEIVERARIAVSAEEFAGFGKNLFGLIAEAEESLL